MRGTLKQLPSAISFLGVALVAMLVIGCRAEPIQTYKVKRPPKDRMIAAIAPVGDSNWYFKMDGADPDVKQNAAEFEEFLRTVKFDAGEAEWKLPKGWKTEEKKDEKGLRYATLYPSPTVSLAVTRFSASSILANVNRWRKQMSLPEIGDQDLPKQTKKLMADGVEMTIVDLIGERKLTAQMPPFAEADMAPLAAPTEPEDVAYTLPKEWTKVAAGQFLTAKFEVKEGDRTANISISTAGGSLLANVNRWRGQVELKSVDEDSLRALLGKVKVGEAEADYVDLAGPKRRIVGAILPRDGRTYFFKMDGPGDLVGQQKPTFEAFLESIRFKKAAED